MLFTSAELIAQFQDYYVRHGIDISKVKSGERWSDRQFAHWPVPECLGGADDQGVDLLKLHHVLVDLVVSGEVQHPCFFSGHAVAALERLPDDMDAETCMFFHWLYETTVGTTRGKSRFKSPEGKIAWFRPGEEPAGWKAWHHASGKKLFKSPEGTLRWLNPGEEPLGWKAWGPTTGRATYQHITTGQRKAMSEDEATSEWVKLGQASGLKTTITCEHCGMENNPGNHARYHGTKCKKKPS